uniref:uncharacterized protein n=1 Tax=Pristiophorus japonicus TaxID=55135 RepID=UPI00398E3476
MAGRRSNHGKKQGANLNQLVPQEGALLPGSKPNSARASASRSQGAGAKGVSSSSASPSSAGRPPNPTTTTRAAEARRSTSSTPRGAESSSNGPTRHTVAAGNANSGTKVLGKATGSKNHPGPKSQPSIAQQPEKISKQKIAEIEKETRGQRGNPAWLEQRSNRITASAAHKISHCNFVNGKSTEVPQSYLKSIVSKGSSVLTPGMKWGIDHETAAIEKYEKVKSKDTGRQISVERCGLVIDPERSWLAASPDGVVVDRATGNTVGLVEVKCPYKHRNHTINKACEDKTFCLERAEGELQLKKNHPYFTQIQCQLAVTGLKNADLTVFTNRETVVVPVQSDREFWKGTVDKLEEFYTGAVLPKLQEQNPVLANEE